MHPYHPQPPHHPQQQPAQSRGFNPPPQTTRPPQHTPYPHPAQPQAQGYAQQYQNHPQYQQQRPAQYYQQQQQQQYAAQQQRYAPQPHSAPPPPSAAPVPNQRYYPPPPPTQAQAYPSHAPSPTYPQARPGPVVPPVRANSQSPDKAGRPLPAPAAATGRSRPISMPPTPVGGFAGQTQPYPPRTTAYTPAHPPASSFSGRPPSHSFSQPQPFQAQAQAQAQPPSQSTPPTQPHPHMPHTQSSPVIRSPAASVRSLESVASKRPLPAPPGGGAATPPPVTPGRPGAPPVTAGAVPPAQRRTLPFSPTKPPSAEEGIKSGRSAIAPPQRSYTLPTPATPQEPSTNGTAPSGAKGDVGQTGAALAKDKGKGPEHPAPPRSTPYVSRTTTQNAPSSSFALPPQPRATQSLAFRLASLSLQEEQAQKRPPNRPAPPTRGSAPARSPARSVIDLEDAPPESTIRRPSVEAKHVRQPVVPASHVRQPLVPTINVPGGGGEGEEAAAAGPSAAPEAPSISVSEAPSINVSEAPSINVVEPPSINVVEAPSISISEPPSINVSEPPSINVSEPPSINISEPPSINISEEPSAPTITVSEAATPTISTSSYSSAIPDIIVADLEGTLETSVNTAQKRKGLICYGCGNGILGRIVSAMGGRWHPSCFKCTVCSELLEHVSSYEHAGKPYCHLDYHEKFAPQCYHCRTPIIDERFITLDDPALGKRTYHEQHFFCAECGDPFLAPTIPGTDTEVVAQEDDVGFTVYKGHPYCEACHVRLRYPKCRRCKRSIRDGMQAVEALGGKWCWECFLCAGCEKPFEDPAFFQRDNKPYCEPCFSVIIKSEM